MASRFLRYVQDTRREMAHVSWPTRTQTIAFTIMVIAISVFAAFYLSMFDAVFTNALKASFEHAPRFLNYESSTGVGADVTATDAEGNIIPDVTATPITEDSTTN